MHKRWLYQFLCSVVVASAVVGVNEATGSSRFLGTLMYPIEILLFPLLRSIYRDESYRNGYFVFCAMSLLLAFILFALFRLANHLPFLRAPLLVSAGIADVTAYPLVFLWLRSFYHISATESLWLLTETLAVLTTAVFYLYRRWRVPSSLSTSLLAAHFCLWGWVGHGYEGLLGLSISYGLWSITFLGSMIHRVTLLLLGFFATLSWARYAVTASESLASSSPAPPVALSPAGASE
jgi:hypothetical protein